MGVSILILKMSFQIQLQDNSRPFGTQVPTISRSMCAKVSVVPRTHTPLISADWKASLSSKKQMSQSDASRLSILTFALHTNGWLDCVIYDNLWVTPSS